jgi:hypothetical protein
MSSQILPQACCAANDGVIVALSNVHGLGLFTTRSFTVGEIICVYTGELTYQLDDTSQSEYIIAAQMKIGDTDEEQSVWLDGREAKDNGPGSYSV